jgi:hypothetical protein
VPDLRFGKEELMNETLSFEELLNLAGKYAFLAEGHSNKSKDHSEIAKMYTLRAKECLDRAEKLEVGK